MPTLTRSKLDYIYNEFIKLVAYLEKQDEILLSLIKSSYEQYIANKLNKATSVYKAISILDNKYTATSVDISISKYSYLIDYSFN